MTIIDTLIEMGFSKERAELAVKRTGTEDVQAAMDWLLSHEEELGAPETIAPSESEVPSEQIPSLSDQESAVPEGPGKPTPEAKSIKCDDCGKLFKTNEEVEFHAAKSGHGNFSESTEEKKPLTDEEKKAQLDKIEAKLKQRRLEREAREKEEALLREKNRIKSGKELLEVKKKHEELEMKKIIEQRKREKEEERLAKQRVRDQIEQDKLARKAKFGNAPPPAESVATPAPPKPSQNYSEVKLQIRMPDGSGLIETFGAKEPLSAVRVYIQMHGGNTAGPFNLMTNFPKKVFLSDDYDKPLDSLGLAPSAVLIVKKN
ncbi:hypothetical protein JTB14_033439 [Gonioctena quinquepunctata]|nr:hypothetical protein JTB14_033439 [Gonioctena quinquepunctata]